MSQWFSIDNSQIVGIAFSVIAFYIFLLIFVRISGLRSFSKMSGHDFAVTIAIGSIFASTIVSDSPSLWQGLLAVALLLLFKKILSIFRFSNFFRKLVDNKPLIVMRDGEMIEENMKKANVTKDDVYAKLRECNALNLKQVRAVVVEATGDVSVLHGDNKDFEDKMLFGCEK